MADCACGACAKAVSRRRSKGRTNGARARWRELCRIGRAAGGVHALSISRDGAWVVTGGYSTIGRIWSIETGKRRGALEGKRGSYGVAFHPDDQRVLSTCDGALCIWDAETGALLHTVDEKAAAPLALSRDGRHAVTAGPRGLLYWEL